MKITLEESEVAQAVAEFVSNKKLLGTDDPDKITVVFVRDLDIAGGMTGEADCFLKESKAT